MEYRVILSGVAASVREAATESKDPYRPRCCWRFLEKAQQLEKQIRRQE